MSFVVELSQIIFDQNDMDEEEIQEEPVFSDEICDSILSLVEMINLPHLEVKILFNKEAGKNHTVICGISTLMKRLEIIF
jgi:hypothetical protein